MRHDGPPGHDHDDYYLALGKYVAEIVYAAGSEELRNGTFKPIPLDQQHHGRNLSPSAVTITFHLSAPAPKSPIISGAFNHEVCGFVATEFYVIQKPGGSAKPVGLPGRADQVLSQNAKKGVASQYANLGCRPYD